MSTIDHLLHANGLYAANYPGARPLRPKLRLAVIACMDSRMDLFGALGLDIGDAHVIRNAGGLPTLDVLRSLALSQRLLGTREVVLIHHTECGMQDFDDTAFRADLLAETGDEPQWDVPGFTDLRAEMRKSLARVQECPWIAHRDDVRGFVFDISTGRIDEVGAADDGRAHKPAKQR
ncbi:MAG: carbonic anhydrase [Actinomycetota bacterium]